MKITSEQKMICNLLSFVTSLIILLLLILFFGIISNASVNSHTTSDEPTDFTSDYLVRFLYDNFGFDYRNDLCNRSTFASYISNNNISLPSDFDNSALTDGNINSIKEYIITVKMPNNLQVTNYGENALSLSDFNNFSLHYYNLGGYGTISLGLYYNVDASMVMGFKENFLARYQDSSLEPFYYTYIPFNAEGEVTYEPDYYYVGGPFAALDNYYLSSDQTTIYNLCAASVPVYGWSPTTCDFNGDGTVSKVTVTDENTGISSNDYQSFFINPISDYKLNTNYFSNNGGGTGSGSEGTDDNHLILENGDWVFNNSQYSAPYSSSINTGSIYPNGNITFNFTPDTYQIEHASDYVIQFNFSFDYDVTYKNWNSNSNSPFNTTSELLNNTKTYSQKFNMAIPLYGIQENLSDFISNGNSKSWTFKQAFDLLFDGSVSNDIKSLSDVLLISKEITEISYNKFNINCDATLKLSNDLTKTSGKISEWYNPMNKKGYTTDTSGKINNNPYNNNGNTNTNDPTQGNQETGNNAPGTAGNNGDNSNNVGGGSSSSNATVGNITINNNNTVNANGGNGSSGSGSGENQSAVNFYNSFNPVNLFFNKIVGSNQSTGEELVDTFGANNWITIMSNTFGFMPEAFWSSITVYLVTCIGIVVIAFIIRIILDLL